MTKRLFGREERSLTPPRCLSGEGHILKTKTFYVHGGFDTRRENIAPTTGITCTMTNFAFIQITDHHLLESEDALREGFCPGHALRMVMRHIAEHVADSADFIISTGDLVEPETDATYQCAVKLLGLNSPAALPGPQKVNVEGLSDYPMYFLPGNHDSRELMTHYFFPDSQAPTLYNFTFVHKDV